MTTNIMIALIVAFTVPAIVAFFLWTNLRLAEGRLELIRRFARDNADYIPDDIGRPHNRTFRRASNYWSKTVLRIADTKPAEVFQRR